jgi:caffeoyl-CoA O-methyltransferase
MRTTTLHDKALDLTPALYDYATRQTSLPADELLLDLVSHTNAAVPNHAHMVVPAEEGALLTLLVRLLRPRVVVEVGTFTGYSSICIARGLETDSRLITFDVSAEWTSVAEHFWERAGVRQRIELVLGPAEKTLPARLADDVVDLAFIDGDKPGYIQYWERIVPHVRPGGLIVADNTLFGGGVIDAAPSVKAAAIRSFNDHVLADSRVDSVLLPVSDGITLAYRREDPPPGPAR